MRRAAAARHAAHRHGQRERRARRLHSVPGRHQQAAVRGCWLRCSLALSRALSSPSAAVGCDGAVPAAAPAAASLPLLEPGDSGAVRLLLPVPSAQRRDQRAHGRLGASVRGAEGARGEGGGGSAGEGAGGRSRAGGRGGRGDRAEGPAASQQAGIAHLAVLLALCFQRRRGRGGADSCGHGRDEEEEDERRLSVGGSAAVAAAVSPSPSMPPTPFTNGSFSPDVSSLGGSVLEDAGEGAGDHSEQQQPLPASREFLSSFTNYPERELRSQRQRSSSRPRDAEEEEPGASLQAAVRATLAFQPSELLPHSRSADIATLTSASASASASSPIPVLPSGSALTPSQSASPSHVARRQASPRARSVSLCLSHAASTACACSSFSQLPCLAVPAACCAAVRPSGRA